nr:Protein of unknown function (DUF1311) [uncultured bacterium]
MKISTVGGSVLLCLLAAISSAAQEQKKPDPCENAQTTVEMRDCAGKEYEAADAELNKAYQQLMSKLDDEGHKTALKEAQLAWIKYRDANCDFESYLNRGGTIYPIVNAGCRTGMTINRTKELQEMLTAER